MSNYSEEMAQQMIVSGNTPNKEKFYYRDWGFIQS